MTARDSNDRALSVRRRQQIMDLVEHTGYVRISDVVELFDVSRATAHRDLEALAQEGLTDRVRGGVVAIQGVAHPSERRAEIVAPDHENDRVHIGFVVPSTRYYYRSVIAGMHSAVSNVGGSLTVICTEWGQTYSDDHAIELLMDANIDGLLLTTSLVAKAFDYGAATRDTTVHEAITSLGVPLVLVEREPSILDQPDVWSVATDHEKGVARAVDHLVSLGHQRVSIAVMNDSGLSHRLIRAWRECAAGYSLDPDAPAFETVDVDASTRGTESSLDEMFTRLALHDVSAVICFNDVVARAVAQHAALRGWSIPEDLSIVAYDDEISAGRSIPLTAVSPPKKVIGTLAVETLQQCLQTRDSPARRIRLEPNLIVRDSTASPYRGRRTS